MLYEISSHVSISRGITKYIPPIISQTVPVKRTEITQSRKLENLAQSKKKENESTRSKLCNGLNRELARRNKDKLDGLNVPMERVPLQSLCQI